MIYSHERVIVSFLAVNMQGKCSFVPKSRASAPLFKFRDADYLFASKTWLKILNNLNVPAPAMVSCSDELTDMF